MLSSRKFALLIGAATCLLAMISAAPIFGADDPLLSMHVEPLPAQDIADNEAMMGPLRQQASAALLRLELAAAAHE